VLIRLFEPLFKAVYPHISKIAAQSKQKAIKNLKKLFSLSFATSFFLFLLVIIFSKDIVELILGKNFKSSIVIMRMLSPLLFIIPAAYILANLSLLPFKLDRYFSRIYISGGVINIILLFFLLYMFNLGAKGAALANLITETILTLMMYLVLRKHNIKIIL